MISLTGIPRCGHQAVAKTERHLRESGGLAELGRSLQGMCWNSPWQQHLVSESAKTATHVAIAAMLDDGDRTAPAQLFWMLLICQGLALNRVLDAGDGEGLELGDS